MKLSSLLILTITATAVNSAALNDTSSNTTTTTTTTTRTREQYEKDTTDIKIALKTTYTANSASEDSSPSSMDEEQKEEIAEDAIDAMGSAFETYEEDQAADSAPLPPRKLCAGKRKPRCCDAGGRMYRDGCERFTASTLPKNRSEFRSTCQAMDKIAMCCLNSLDMAQVGIFCRKARK